MASYREIASNGLWKNNPGLVQLLGLCPLLGVSNSGWLAANSLTQADFAQEADWLSRSGFQLNIE